MFQWILRYLGMDNPRSRAKRIARMKESEALALARQTTERSPDSESLYFTDIVEEEGEAIWVFTSASIGKSLIVQIRDRDGAIVRKERIGRR